MSEIDDFLRTSTYNVLKLSYDDLMDLITLTGMATDSDKIPDADRERMKLLNEKLRHIKPSKYLESIN